MRKNHKENNEIKNDDRVVDDNVIKEMYWEFLESPEWMMNAQCVRHDIENPEEIIDPIKDAEFIMDNLCSSCSVKDICYSWSKKFNISYGVYGGNIINKEK